MMGARLYHFLCFACLFIGLNPWALAQNYDKEMQRLGLVDIQSLDSTIRVDLKYSSKDNFLQEDLYGDLDRCYLHPGFAKRICQAQETLRKLKPGYSLIIYDGARPMSIQRKMYNKVAGTALKIYVAPASRGGRHNYGVAVDVSIVDERGKPLDMGTSFDYFGPEAHVGVEDKYIRLGHFALEVKNNRALLDKVMRSVGLRPYDKEWWHYQELIPMKQVRQRYKRLDF